MFSSFERMIAFRYLRARRKESFVSVIVGFSLAGIALGVATLIVVMAVMNGFRDELEGRIIGVGGHVVVSHGPAGIWNYDDIAKQIAAIDGVKAVMPQVEGQVMAMAGKYTRGAMVKGIRPEDLQKKTLLTDHIAQGGLEQFSGRSVVFVGDKLARYLGVRPGDSITLVSPRTRATVVGAVPRLKTFEVVGTFDVGMYEYDSSYIYMPLEAAQIYFQYSSVASELEILVDDLPDAFGVARKIAEALPPTFDVTDWQRMNAQFFNALTVERNVMFLILTLIILIAAFNIITGLVMLVKDKGRDIAILRTMGATRRNIMRVFFLCGASIGILGTALGVGLGLAFALNIESIRRWLEQFTGADLFAEEIYFLSQLPAIVKAEDVILVAAIALGLSFLATLYPSWRAAKLEPVEALRYE